MPDSVRPQRRQPTRLPHPWDSPGKNTGVACHFLLQYMKVKSESEVAQSCLILHNPMDCSPPGSSVHGIFQARVLEWDAIAFSGPHMHGHLKSILSSHFSFPSPLPLSLCLSFNIHLPISTYFLKALKLHHIPVLCMLTGKFYPSLHWVQPGNCQARTPQLLKPAHLRALALQKREATAMRSPRITTRE